MPDYNPEIERNLTRSRDTIENLQKDLRDAHCAGHFMVHVVEYRDVTVAGYEHVTGMGVRVQPNTRADTRKLFILVEDGVVTRFDVPERPPESANQNGINKAIVVSHDWYEKAPRPGFY